MLKKMFFFVTVMLLQSLSIVESAELSAVKKVLISQVVEHPALNKTVNGMKDALEEAGFKNQENLILKVESAQGSMALATQIAAKFSKQNPDVVVAVGTIAAQSFLKYANNDEIKLIFSSVTDPVGAHIVKTVAGKHKSISGVSNFIEIEPQIDLFLKLQPDLKKLGILYNPGEINSVAIVNKLEKLLPSKGVVLVKQAVAKTSDVAQAAIKLANMSNAIFVSNDNTILSTLNSVIRAANAVKIPVYVSDTDAVELGAVAALGPNQYDIGKQTGRMVARVLNGEPIEQISIEFPQKMELYLNLEAAKTANITIPTEILNQAVSILPVKDQS